MATRDDRTLERKIYFFFVNVGVEPSGDWTPFDTHRVLAAIDRLSFNNGERYLDLKADDAVYCLFVDRNGRQKSLARWAKIRRAGLPEIELRGNFRNLDIREDEGIAEKSHVIFYPGNVIGVESNFYGPRATRLGLYLRRKAEAIVPRNVVIEPLFRPDVRARLRELRDVTLLKISAAASFADDIGRVDQSLGRAFRASAEAANAEEIEITMKRIQPLAGTDRLAWVRRLAQNLLGRADAEAEITEFKVSGPSVEDEKMLPLDLLSDKLVATKRILRQQARTRVVDSQSAFDAIEEAYEELRGSINTAVADIPRPEPPRP